MSTLHEQYRGFNIEELLQAIEGNAEPGSPHFVYLEHLLSLRTAELINKQLTATVATISTSANLLKGTLSNSSEWLLNAIAVGTERGDENAKLIVGNIDGLTKALTAASEDIKKAGGQSAQLGRGLNLLTAIVAMAALISAGATALAAWETKRQADLTEQQISRSRTDTAPASNAPAGKLAATISRTRRA